MGPRKKFKKIPKRRNIPPYQIFQWDVEEETVQELMKRLN